MQTREMRTISRGMDTDTSPLLIEDGKYTYAINSYLASVDGPDVGTLVNEKGTLAIRDLLPDGANECIGGCEDIEAQSVIAFMFNSLGNHSIRRYSVTEQTVDVIYEGPLLNFKRENRIYGADVIEGLLYWTDGYFETYMIQPTLGGISVEGYNPPRKINIERALAGEYQEIDFQVLDRIKWPPAYAPLARYRTNIEKKTNFLRRRMFQFRYRYIYDDFERSVWSPISESRIPPGIEFSESLFVSDIALDNEIVISINTGHHTVKRIEVAFRVGNDRPFGIFKEIEKERDSLGDFQEIEVVFNGNESSSALTSEENGKNYDRVPQISADQELIEGGRLVDANIVEGYDAPAPFVQDAFGPGSALNSSAQFSRRRISITTPVSASWVNDNFLGQSRTGITLPNYQDISPGMTALFVIGGAEYEYTFTMTQNSQLNFWFELGRYLEGIGFNVNQIFPDDDLPLGYGISTPFPSGDVLTITWGPEDEFPNSPFSGLFFSSEGDGFTRVKSHKTGSDHVYGLVYSDRAERNCSVVTSDDLSFYLPFYTEEGGVPSSTYNNSVVVHDALLTLVHQPPEWATSYKVVKKVKPRVLSFGQYSIRESYTNSQGFLGFLLDDYVSDPETSRAIRHEIKDGDIVRFITKGVNADLELQGFCNGYYEFEVRRYYPDSNAIDLNFRGTVSDIGPSPEIWAKGSLIEVFTPSFTVDDDESLWYEVGQNHPIIEPHTENRRHGVDESLTQFAIVQENDIGGWTTTMRFSSGGDVYLKTRLMRASTLEGDDSAGPVAQYWVEDYNLSDLYASDWHSWGRLHTYDPDARRIEFQTGLRYSEVYRQNTFWNGLSSVDESNFDSVKDLHGPIQRIVQVGFVLKVLQSSKLTSIYLSRQVLFNADGTSNISSSQSVLGTQNASDTDYGTVHPNSVVKSDRHLYFFDALNGIVIRDASNGSEPISDYGMRAFFLDASKEILQNPSTIVIGGIDKGFNRYTLTVRSPIDGSIEQEVADQIEYEGYTISFNEMANTWISFHSWIPEECLNRSSYFMTFKNGNAYLMNQGDVRCEFYGEKYEQGVSIPFNMMPNLTKVYKSISVESNVKWYSPEKGDVKTMASHDQAGGESRLLESRFVEREGSFYADMAMDMNTPNVDIPVINGRPMRGKALSVKLINMADEKVYLLSASTAFTKKHEKWEITSQNQDILQASQEDFESNRPSC